MEKETGVGRDRSRSYRGFLADHVSIMLFDLLTFYSYLKQYHRFFCNLPRFVGESNRCTVRHGADTIPLSRTKVSFY